MLSFLLKMSKGFNLSSLVLTQKLTWGVTTCGTEPIYGDLYNDPQMPTVRGSLICAKGCRCPPIDRAFPALGP